MKKIFLALAICFSFAFSVTVFAEDTGEYFFKNNISGDTRLIDMHMLGAHDAFTASHNSKSPVDAAGVKIGDSGANAASYDVIWNTFGGINSSKAQSADVDTMLNSGVRYFDVRLSKYLSGGEFYTTHGRISDQFTGEGGVAKRIAAWAASHPGEIIILDFQSLFDIDTSNGSATQDSWKNLAAKLENDGVMKYVYTSTGSISSITYDSLTNGGTRCAIVIFGQVTGSWADNRFINRRDSDGYLRSFWESKSSVEDVRARIASEANELKVNSDGYFYKLRVMQAQLTGSNLLSDADDSNIKILTDERFDEWNELMPILLVDNVTTDSGNFNSLAVEKLARKNREYVDGIYRESVGSYTLTGDNENVPLNVKFEARRTGDVLKLSLSDGADIDGKMTLIIKSQGKKQKLYKDGVLLGETGNNGVLKAEIEHMGEYRLVDGDNIDFSANIPLLWYNFTDENGLEDISGNSLNAAAVGNPEIGKGKAVLSDGNVIQIPSGISGRLQSYTVTAWVNMTGQTSASRLFDIGRGARSSIFAHVGTDKTSSGYKLNGGTTVTAEADGLEVGEWTHVAAMYDAGKLTVYINGKAAASAYTQNAAPDNLGDIFNPNGNFIGRTQWYFDEGQRASNPDINAEIADFRIYDSALTEKEISRLARVPELRCCDAATGELLYSVPMSVPAAMSGSDLPERLDGGYQLEKVTLVEDMAGESNVIALYKKASSIEVTDENGIVTAKISVTDKTDGAKLYIAVYENDTLVGVASTAVEALYGEVSKEIEEGQEYKVYFWDGRLIPLR